MLSLGAMSLGPETADRVSISVLPSTVGDVDGGGGLEAASLPAIEDRPWWDDETMLDSQEAVSMQEVRGLELRQLAT
jgi:hypothetical protein